MFVAIMDTDANGRVAKYQEFPDLAAAEAHVDKFRDRYPQAFAAPMPAENFGDWKVNPAAKRISIEMRPPEQPRAEGGLSAQMKALAARVAALESKAR